MKITKKQIIALDKGETTVRELFPEVFETKLQIGKWYKSENHLICFEEKVNDIYYYYGFYNKTWYDNTGKIKDNYITNKNLLNSLLPATEEEVKDALVKEAIKRGFKEGALIKKTGINSYFKFKFEQIKQKDFKYFPKLNILDSQNGHIFENGKWAEIVETITKEEAEKQLGKVIID